MGDAVGRALRPLRPGRRTEDRLRPAALLHVPRSEPAGGSGGGKKRDGPRTGWICAVTQERQAAGGGDEVSTGSSGVITLNPRSVEGGDGTLAREAPEP